VWPGLYDRRHLPQFARVENWDVEANCEAEDKRILFAWSNGNHRWVSAASCALALNVTKEGVVWKKRRVSKRNKHVRRAFADFKIEYSCVRRGQLGVYVEIMEIALRNDRLFD
jgi:hypothetical protein